MYSDHSDSAMEDALLAEELKARMSVARKEREGDAFAAGKKLLNEEIEDDDGDEHTEFNRSISKETAANAKLSAPELLHFPVVNLSPQFQKDENVMDSDDSDDDYSPNKNSSNPPLPPSDADEAEIDLRYSELYKKAQEMHDREAKGKALHSTVFSTALQTPAETIPSASELETSSPSNNNSKHVNVVAQGSILIDSENVPVGSKPKKHVTFAEGTAPPAVSGIALAIIKHQQNPGGFMEYTVQVCNALDSVINVFLFMRECIKCNLNIYCSIDITERSKLDISKTVQSISEVSNRITIRI